MTHSRIIDLEKLQGGDGIGRKALNLRWMIQHHYPVPKTYVLPYQPSGSRFGPEQDAQDELKPELEKILNPDQIYAVRSSANLEDSTHLSYAGQFTTYLSLRGVQEVSKAVNQILGAGVSEMIQAYTSKTNQDAGQLQMAVIIQEMVQPVVSGVAFSKNPLTGLDEVIVEAVQGSGEALVQEGKTPDRWVNKWGKWVAQPVESQIDLQLIQQVVSQTTKISQAYGAPVDLEWVYNGQELYWVQLRPITHLDEINIYSNRISKEVFPGMIKPLVWSVNIPLVNSAWIQLFTRLIGKNDLQPDELARSFAYRAYFNMGVIGQIFTMLGFPKESLELLMGMQGGDERPRFRPSGKTMRHLPRMLVFGAGLLGIGSKIMPAMQQIRAECATLVSQYLQNIDETGLLAEIDRLYLINQKAAYFNIVAPLLMGLYNLFLKRQLSTIGVDFSAFDLTHGLTELEDYDPNPYLRQLADHFNHLDETTRSRLAASADPDEANLPEPFREEVVQFIQQFGHLSDSGNDFSSVPWRENRPLVFQMIQSEAQRQRDAGPKSDSDQEICQDKDQTSRLDQSGSKLKWEELKLTRLQRLRMGPIYQRARIFRLYREAVSSTYTYGYGLFRIYFLELGQRLVKRGLLESPDDIFYLSWDEVKASIQPEMLPSQESGAGNFFDLVAKRKREMESSRDLILPEIIYGNELPPMQNPDQLGDIRQGIPSSGGYYRGPAKIIRSVSDFGKLCKGDVLVIPFSDVSWTPLFTQAGAVVAESGGMLSHSSIVAREFNLPCVVSVPLACQIPDDTILTVDGYKGEIHLHNDRSPISVMGLEM
jgi:phosphohistidine swiveling domain-containing protein